MPEYLETTADKFTFRVAIGRFYSPEGVWAMWAQAETANRVRVGLADFVQQHSGDVAFLSVRPVGTRLLAGDELAEMETVKVNLSVHTPVGGTIIENQQGPRIDAGGGQPGPLRRRLARGDRDGELGDGSREAARRPRLPVRHASAGRAGAPEQMTSESTQVVVVPCSGMGKPYGTVSREAAYDLCDDLRPGATRLIALAKLVLGEPEASERVRACPAVTIDGCKLMCASKLVTLSGGTVAHEVAVLDVYRRYKELKPEGIEALNDAGLKLARVLAEEVALAVDDIRRTAASPGGRHA